MKHFFKILLSIGIVLFIQVARAEGGTCPDGYYPIGGGAVNSCAPLPPGYYSNNSGNNYTPPPPVKWADRWGSIAIGAHPNNDGIVGKSSNMSSKLLAEMAAMKDCESQGGRSTCQINTTYHNSCIALAVGVSHGGASSGGQNSDEAKQHSIEACTNSGGKNCRVIYSDCSMAVRVQ